MRSKKIVLSFDDLKNGRGIEYGDGFKFYDLDEKSIIKRLQDKLNISMQQADEYFRMYGTKND